MLTATIRSRVEPELKEEATRILESCGLDLSTAIRLFLNNVVVAKGLPFDILPNPTTIAAMEEARKLSARFSSL
ncbi:type II toxin-antitoxin system RelB/DinJ family antitoxin [Duganella sp.]|uniref:type II toxin-antitoxin system RelB/DinJ family antitoxin n=1 Tax=Duganella sp. TaxID=1904440 RepID=UPI0039C8693E